VLEGGNPGVTPVRPAACHSSSRLSPRCVFFDAFGTLVTLHRPFERLKANLESLGYSIPLGDVEAAMRQEFAYYIAHSVKASDPERLRRLRLECAGVLLEALRERGHALSVGCEEMVDALMDAIRFELYPDALPALQALKERGVGIGLISNWDCSLQEVVRDLGLNAYLECVIISALCGCEKPDPGLFHEALRQAGVAAEETFHIGDSYEKDVLGARAAGIAPILLDRQGKHSPGDAPVARDLLEAVELLSRQPGQARWPDA